MRSSRASSLPATGWTTRSAWPSSSDCPVPPCGAQFRNWSTRACSSASAGSGTQVVHGQVTRPVELTSLFDDLASHHQAPATTVLTNEVIDAERRGGVEAGRPARAPRCCTCAGCGSRTAEPLAIMENFLPEDLLSIGDGDLEARGLYQLMRGKGVNIRVAKQRIGARTGTPEECSLFGEKRGSPVLTMERAAHDDSGRPVEWGRHCLSRQPVLVRGDAGGPLSRARPPQRRHTAGGRRAPTVRPVRPPPTLRNRSPGHHIRPSAPPAPGQVPRPASRRGGRGARVRRDIGSGR